MSVATDSRLMALALSLGDRNLGSTWPNPSVGALVVDETGETPLIIAQGITQPGGRPHAERVALDSAGTRASGKTLYVTLEPCCHHGRSAPCSDAVVASGIARVVSAMEDPDARVAGGGHARLREAGIAVEVGCLAGQAKKGHLGHILRVTEGRPAVTVKLARSTEGFAGSRVGPRLMITGESAGARVHLMRAHADAIMVGIGTVLSDDPLLDVRLPGLEHRSPLRIIVDSRLRLPERARVVVDCGRVPTWVVTTPAASADAERDLSARGITVLRVEADETGRVDPAAMLSRLGEIGLTRILCEGGPDLANALARADLIDALTLVTGRSARGRGDVPALGPDLQQRMDALRPTGEEQAGPDLFMFWEKP